MAAIVSVIIPAYNAKKTIKQCVDSIRNQSYLNIEIIVIDDGSTDGTSQELKQIEDTRIIYYKQSNKGVSASRNTGLKISKGEFIVFVDSDDMIDANLIEYMVEFAENNFLDMVCCSHTEEYSTIVGGNSNLATAFIANNNSDIENHFGDIFVGMTVGKLFRKKIIDENNIEFPIGINLAEDFCFNMAVLKETNKVGKVDGAFYRIINSNPYSLSKKYISNIEKCIDMQMQIWDQLKTRYPGLDKVYAEKDMDFKLHKIKIYANNFYRKGSNISYFESVNKIRDFLLNNPQLFVDNQKITKKGSLIRKLESAIIKTRNAFLIGTMYYLKEHIRNVKLKCMWKSSN